MVCDDMLRGIVTYRVEKKVLGGLVCTALDASVMYTLFGVLVHIGDTLSDKTPGRGHYVSYVKVQNGDWYKMNDRSVSRTSEECVLKQQAYMLHYVRDN